MESDVWEEPARFLKRPKNVRQQMETFGHWKHCEGRDWWAEGQAGASVCVCVCLSVCVCVCVKHGGQTVRKQNYNYLSARQIYSDWSLCRSFHIGYNHVKLYVIMCRGLIELLKPASWCKHCSCVPTGAWVHSSLLYPGLWDEFSSADSNSPEGSAPRCARQGRS